ncbi:hypothetical protein PILCRDRAFT_812464 [Piloderma croceum F 1598]|uniref:F-box domain-containing protein n=1 Tax=Piloderma croceum (strain F 1598) TaxID=765440 RepID=A0A0C3GG79_PILCF|nr:hypothetical protein PILCRDRAFT_812464 [Piloderma croceum F 1598]
MSSAMNSPFQHRLNSNYAPLEDECHHIAQIVTDQDKRISQIDEEIHRLHRLLQPLLRDRGEVHAFREAHRQLLSPSRRIPPELWSEVFVHCLPAGKFVKIDVQEAPMLLAQVSSLWRSIALSTPGLWNSIAVGGANGVVLTSKSTLISTWLGRSGNLPLSIAIVQMGLPVPQQEEDFVNAFIPFTPQIKDLTMFAPQSMIQRLIGNQDISGLTNLKIAITNDGDGGQPLNISESAIRVRHLFIIHYRSSLDIFHFPWAQLTEFDGESLPFNECFNIFRQFHNLSRLHLRSVSGEYDGVIHPHVLMPNLVSLELNLLDTDIGCMWNNLTLPRLQEANFSFFIEDSWQKLELFALLDRSSCSLCTLYISNNISEEDLVECVERIPSLRNVILRSCWDDKYPLSDRVSRMLEQRATSAMNVD